jgi:hypothetical protein
MGVVAIRSGDAEAHRVWMWRFAGSMWGAFWGYRVIMLVPDPILRDTDGWTFLIPSWVSVPAGILIAEAIRVRRDRRSIAFGHPNQITIWKSQLETGRPTFSVPAVASPQSRSWT